MHSIKLRHTPDGYVDHLDLALSLWIISDGLWEEFEQYADDCRKPYPGALYEDDLQSFAHRHDLQMQA